MKHHLILFCFVLLQYTAFSQKTPADRALQKMEVENYEAAIAEWDKAIAADSTSAEAFFKRGFCHAMLQEHKEALIDFNRAIFMNADNGEWYSERGIAKLNLRDMDGACNDWRTASKLGFPAATDLLSEYCP